MSHSVSVQPGRRTLVRNVTPTSACTLAAAHCSPPELQHRDSFVSDFRKMSVPPPPDPVDVLFCLLILFINTPSKTNKKISFTFLSVCCNTVQTCSRCSTSQHTRDRVASGGEAHVSRLLQMLWCAVGDGQSDAVISVSYASLSLTQIRSWLLKPLPVPPHADAPQLLLLPDRQQHRTLRSCCRNKSVLSLK